MNVYEPFIRRPVMAVLLLISILALGISAFIKMPVSNLPDVNYPVITVSVPFPGANPTIMANTVAVPLEKQFMAIPGIRYVTSTNTLGVSTIILQFEIDRNIDLAAVDVEAAIAAALPQLPANLPHTPTYKKVNPSSTPIVYIALTSATIPSFKLYDYGNTFIGQRISTLEGVAQVNVYGSPFAVRAQIDPGAIASMGISLQDLALVIDNNNQYQPLGQFDGDMRASIIYDNGGLFDADAYKSIVVAYRDGAPVKLDDIGKIVDSTQNDRSIRRYINKEVNQECVILAILGQPGSNIVDVADKVKALIPEFSHQLPKALELNIFFDRSVSIRASIKDVEFTLLVAFLLVVLVIYFYLGKGRDTIIPSIVMPLSLIATMAIIYPMGYTLDNLSLMAMTLSIGFIIDDAIVVLENIVRRIEKGETPFIASILGSKQISFTIASMTLSLIAVFIPLIFMAGVIGKLFQEFAITLAIITLMSGLISLTFTPMLCSKFLRPAIKGETSRQLVWAEKIQVNLLYLYKKCLRWSFRNRIIILIMGLGCIVGSIILFKILPTDFIPDEDIGFILGYTEAEQGTSSDQMRLLQAQVVDVIRRHDSVKSVVSLVATPEYRQGIVFMEMIPRSDRESIQDLIRIFNADLEQIPGVNVYLRNIPLIDLNIGSQVRGSYQYLIQNLNTEDLYTSADALFLKMRENPMFQGVSSDLENKTPQINLDIHRDYASTLGIQTANLEEALLLSYSGNRVSRIQTPIDQYDVILELGRDFQRTPNSLNSLYLRSDTTQAFVPLNALVTQSDGVGPSSINHFAQFPSVTITFNIDPDTPLSIGLAELRRLADETLGPFSIGDVKGAAQTFEESISSISLLLIITIIVIYLILGLLYESYIHPITILSTLPSAILGGLLILYVTNRPLSLYAYLGLVLLIGLVKKNGIMVVDYALDNLRSRRGNPERAVFEACIARFRPIMMTTFAAIMGAIPLALGIGEGAASRKPLGYVIIGGMVISQLITLFLTPIVFLYFERLRERFQPKRPRID